MLLIFSTPVLIRHLRQLKTVVFLHWCLKCAVLLSQKLQRNKLECFTLSVIMLRVMVPEIWSPKIH